MAVVRMFSVRRSPTNLIRYASNAEKTEKGVFVSAQNCSVLDAAERIAATKKRLGKETGVEAYQVILDYLPGEISPVQAHLLSVELSRRVLPEYEAVAATHVNGRSVHTHIVFNPVSLYTGRRFSVQYQVFLDQIREELVQIGSEHALPLDFTPVPKNQPYYKWYCRENGILSGQEMLLMDAEECLTCAFSLENFYDLMRSAGYTVTVAEDGPLFTIPGMQKSCFLTRDGNPLGEDDLCKIISDYLNSPELPPLSERPALPPRPERIDTLPELYKYWTDLIRFVGKGGISPFPEIQYGNASNLKEYESRKSFLIDHGIHTVKELSAFREDQSIRLQELTAELRSMQKTYQKHWRRFRALDRIDHAKELRRKDRNQTTGDLELMDAKRVLKRYDPDALWALRIDLQKKRKEKRAECSRLRGIIKRTDFILQEIEAIDRKAGHPFTGEGLKGREGSNERKQRHADREDHERA